MENFSEHKKVPSKIVPTIVYSQILELQDLRSTVQFFNELFLLTETILLAEDQHQTFRNKGFPLDSSIMDISHKKSDAANGRICKHRLSRE